MRKKIFYVLLGISVLINFGFGISILLNSESLKKHRLEQPQVLSDYRVSNERNDIEYYDGMDLAVFGRFHQERNFNRLSLKYKETVRPIIWDLSQNSAGISVCFSTNSPIIRVKWILNENSNVLNMTKIGACGLDLYCKVRKKWQFVNSAIPTGIENEYLIISNMDSTVKSFLLNLPLYDGVKKVEIGVKKGFDLIKDSSLLTGQKKQIVFYGTSITQGGAASRPGMAYPSIISRNLGIEVVNFGFSGNGKFESSIGQAICQIDASLYVIDCTPNSPPDTIKANALRLIKQLKKAKPQVPILLVESIIREYSYFKITDETIFGGIKFIEAQNRELKNQYDLAKKMGFTNLHYLESYDLIGSDHEGTVDGTHLSDLGQFRIAEKVQKKIVEILDIK